MAIIVATDSTAQTLLNSTDRLYVPGDVSLIVGTAAIGSATPVSVIDIAVDGTVVSLTDVAILLAAGGGSDLHVVVGTDGLVRSLLFSGIFLGDALSSQIVNSGEIVGVRGVFASGSDDLRIENHGETRGTSAQGIFAQFCDDITIVNSGTLSGTHGIDLFGSTGTILNTGSVLATDPGGAAIQAAFSNGPLLIVNSGSLASAVAAANLSSGADTFRNSGIVVGDLLFNDGADRYDGRGGTVAGVVNGGTGLDTLIGGEAGEIFEGSGPDSLFGDPDADRIEGRGGDDLLSGGFGGDRLFGGTGNDTVIGGSGRDSMFGGAEADIFRFLAAADSAFATPDSLRDFAQGEDLVDLEDVNPGEVAFQGTGGFLAGGAASLRYTVNAIGHAVVQLDNDGNGTADMKVVVQNVAVLTAGDFVL